MKKYKREAVGVNNVNVMATFAMNLINALKNGQFNITDEKVTESEEFAKFLLICSREIEAEERTREDLAECIGIALSAISKLWDTTKLQENIKKLLTED